MNTWTYTAETIPAGLELTDTIDASDHLPLYMVIDIPEPGELDDNEGVDLADFSILASHWQDTGCGICDWADLTGDGSVLLDDLLVFSSNWLTGKVIEPGITYQIEPCNLEGSQSGPGLEGEELRFSVTVQGNYVYFEDMTKANCCPDELELQMTVDDNLIIIFETEYLSMPCDCICDFPVTATLGLFAPGTYTLEVYQEEYYGGFIGSTTFTIE